jgi:hypothetical protein
MLNALKIKIYCFFNIVNVRSWSKYYEDGIQNGQKIIERFIILFVALMQVLDVYTYIFEIVKTYFVKNWRDSGSDKFQ